ncbi:MAG TPA: hypothetical protein VFE42_24005 [Chloroflexota bacterium]|nr:hypothetical protein [Chloroflexota bacterium]
MVTGVRGRVIDIHRATSDAGIAMTDEELYAELRAAVQVLRLARQDAQRHVTSAVRDETPDWLLERLDAALRAIDSCADDVSRFIREDRSGAVTPTISEDE